MNTLNTYGSIIKGLREQRKLSQVTVAKKIGISRASYITIEQGKRELSFSEAKKLCAFLGITLRELEVGQAQNYEKYKQMLLAFLRLSNKIPKTKLAKLLYFADFGWFYYHLQSMSGMQYRKIQYGPVPDSYFRIIDELFDDGKIDIDQTEDGAMLISETRRGAKVALSEINAAEKKLIKSIADKWKGKNTKEIVAFTHNQLPYLCADDNDIVSYNVVTQENPDEVY